MKTYILFTLGLLITTPAFAQQKIGYFDSAEIIESLPEARDVQAQLDQLADEWRQEIARRKQELDAKFKEFRTQSLLYSDEVRRQKEDEIIQMEQQISKFQNDKFGVDGELFKQQSNLMKPIQNSIFKAVQLIADEEKYDYIFDRSGQIMIMYANPEYNLTEEILKRVRATGIE